MTELTINETLAEGMTRQWNVKNLVYAGETAYQKVVIGHTAHGVTLFCGDERQSSELSQLTYHEALTIPAFLLADQLRNVLIIGSSEGVASQLAIHAGAVHVDHVDIDAEVVKLCAKHLPYGYTQEELAAAEQREGPIKVHYEDGWRFLAEASEGSVLYDVIIVDLPDETEDDEAQHNRLYGTTFLTMCKKVLAPGGIIAVQAGCPTMWRNATLQRAWHRFHQMFGNVTYFGSDEHEWSFLFGRVDSLADAEATMAARLQTLSYRPASIDLLTLRGCTVAPYLARHQR